MQNEFTRRNFLEFMGSSALALSLAGSTAGFLQACTSAPKTKRILAGKDYLALDPTATDSLQLANGLHYQVMLRWQDSLNQKGLKFGNNNDYLAYFPLAEKNGEGLLCVNHETPGYLFATDWKPGDASKSREQIEIERGNVGVSIVHLREGKPVFDSVYNRRIDGRTPIRIVSERPLVKESRAIGTLGNCAGGETPWGTYLTCEENYQDFYGESVQENGKTIRRPSKNFNWEFEFPEPPEHYGWVVEINPRTGEAKKLTALGRFAHECATVRKAEDGRCVVYSGDDSVGEHLYKFISDRPGSLETGRLYVANLEKGRWLPLSRAENPELAKKFKDQTELLIRAREASKIVGATPLDRPEDIEICPRTGAVYTTLTNNAARMNFFGSILKLEEKNNDPFALEFRSSTFLAGGEATGFACPDNLAFDRKGNLWMTTDMPGSNMNKAPYTKFKNNGLFFIPMEGPNAGRAFLIASGPTDSELTGPCFSPDGRSLFLSVQHPGEYSKNRENPTSRWPNGGKDIPRSAVVAISGPLLDTIMG
jgi:secreted PhoX family phosphatase